MKLAKCPNPWCEDSTPQTYSHGTKEYVGHCFACGIETDPFPTEQQAIEAWNHRPFEAHAVEVLFKYISRHHEMTDWKEKEMRAEARQLLGINDKEGE